MTAERMAQFLGVYLDREWIVVQAENQLNLLMQHIVDQYPTMHKGRIKSPLILLWRSPFANVYLSGTLPPIYLALAAVLLMLSALARHRKSPAGAFGDPAPRTRNSLVNGRKRLELVGELGVENLLVALAGGGLALVATVWTARTLSAFLPITSLPLSLDGRVDRQVLLAAILVSILTAVISGVALCAARFRHFSDVDFERRGSQYVRGASEVSSRGESRDGAGFHVAGSAYLRGIVLRSLVIGGGRGDSREVRTRDMIPK